MLRWVCVLLTSSNSQARDFSNIPSSRITRKPKMYTTHWEYDTALFNGSGDEAVSHVRKSRVLNCPFRRINHLMPLLGNEFLAMENAMWHRRPRKHIILGTHSENVGGSQCGNGGNSRFGTRAVMASHVTSLLPTWKFRSQYPWS